MNTGIGSGASAPPRTCARQFPQRATAQLMPPRHGRERRAGLFHLGHDAELLLQPPTVPALNPGDDLHPDTRPRS